MRKLISGFVLLAFLVGSVCPPQAGAQSLDSLSLMSPPGTPITLSPEYVPAQLKGMVIDPNDPFKFNFIIYRGDQELSADEKQAEYPKLVKYFLSSLAIPDDDQWVNLSPYEQTNIISESFGQTEMGRDLLAQDYLLKQLTASLTDPDTDLGKLFWNRVYQRAYEKFGTTAIPADIISKVWVVPDQVVIYEKDDTVYVVEQHLKVLTDKDYLAMKENLLTTSGEEGEVVQLTSDVLREVIVPAIEKEVNTAKNFAPVRQVYSGMLLAAWYKRALKESILNRVYGDRAKLEGVSQDDPSQNQEIWKQYVDAFEQGVVNMVKREMDPATQTVIPRKYFSGGFRGEKEAIERAQITHVMTPAVKDSAQRTMSRIDNATVKLEFAKPTKKISQINVSLDDSFRALPEGTVASKMSTDGDVAVTRNEFNQVQGLRNVATGEMVKFEGPQIGQVSVVAFASGDKANRVVTVSAGEIRSWDTTTGKPVAGFSGDFAKVSAAAVSPDGRVVALPNIEKPEVVLLDANTGAHIATFTAPESSGGVKAVTFSPDGAKVAFSGNNGSISVGDVTTYQTKSVETSAPVTALAFSNDGQKLVGGGVEGSLMRLDVTTNNITRLESVADSRPVTSLAVAPDGKTVVVADASGFRVQDMDRGKSQVEVRQPEGIDAVAFSPTTGKLLALSSRGELKSFNVATERRETVKRVTSNVAVLSVQDGSGVKLGSVNVPVAQAVVLERPELQSFVRSVGVQLQERSAGQAVTVTVPATGVAPLIMRSAPASFGITELEKAPGSTGRQEIVFSVPEARAGAFSSWVSDWEKVTAENPSTMPEISAGFAVARQEQPVFELGETSGSPTRLSPQKVESVAVEVVRQIKQGPADAAREIRLEPVEAAFVKAVVPDAWGVVSSSESGQATVLRVPKTSVQNMEKLMSRVSTVAAINKPDFAIPETSLTRLTDAGVTFEPAKPGTLSVQIDMKKANLPGIETNELEALKLVAKEAGLEPVALRVEKKTFDTASGKLKIQIGGANIASLDKADKLGGIDLNQSNLDMHIKRDGAGVPLPISQQNLEDLQMDGLVPVILDIQPGSDMPLFNQAQSAN